MANLSSSLDSSGRSLSAPPPPRNLKSNIKRVSFSTSPPPSPREETLSRSRRTSSGLSSDPSLATRSVFSGISGESRKGGIDVSSADSNQMDPKDREDTPVRLRRTVDQQELPLVRTTSLRFDSLSELQKLQEQVKEVKESVDHLNTNIMVMTNCCLSNFGIIKQQLEELKLGQQQMLNSQKDNIAATPSTNTERKELKKSETDFNL